jgi:hypothetical protein
MSEIKSKFDEFKNSENGRIIIEKRQLLENLDTISEEVF